jgi:formate--tetrahydrofolate ligase
MAVLCLAQDMTDLKQKIGGILIGYDSLKKPVFVRDIGVQGAAAALLKHAINPNLVQSVEGAPVFIHGGPFANIAHGCNSLIATRMALRLAEFTVTEAGFGADLGAEKFFDIKCRLGGLTPHAAVLVVTNRAFKLHGAANIAKHVDSLKQFGVPVIISVNRFAADAKRELSMLRDTCAGLGVEACITDFRESGGRGGLELAEKTAALCSGRSRFKPLYGLELEIEEKIERIARSIYGAAHVEYSAAALKDVKRIRDLGFSGLPVCMAKTQSSLSDNPKLMGRPENFTISVSGAKVSAGAGFVVIYTGKIMTMPGLPKLPAALEINIDENGNISGLF